MTTYVRYLPEDRRLDLASLAPGDYQLITELHGEIRRGEPVLLCLMPGGQDGEMFVRKTGARYFAAHFPGEGHGPHPIALESPEHRRQKEYWARGAEAAGLRAATEYPVPGGRLDVAITGGAVATDIEIQRSEITAAAAKGRTTRYARAGFLPVWFNDGGTRPLWLKEVPALGCNRVPWNEQLPRPRAVTATGLTAIEAVRCAVGAFDRCPDGQPRPCGRFHARRAPWAGLSVDDVAAMIPSGDIVPMRGQDGLVYLVSPASMARHQELTGGLGQWLPGAKAPGKRRLRGPQPSEICRNPVHHPELPGETGDDAEPRVPLRYDGGEPRGPGIYLAGLCVICGRGTVHTGPDGLAQHARCLRA
jgi:hypothetical protein